MLNELIFEVTRYLECWKTISNACHKRFLMHIIKDCLSHSMHYY